MKTSLRDFTVAIALAVLLTAPLALPCRALAGEPLLSCRDTYTEYAGVAQHRTKVKDAILKTLIVATPTVALAVPVGIALGGVTGALLGPWTGAMFGATPSIIGVLQAHRFKCSLEKAIDIMNWVDPASDPRWVEFPETLRKIHRDLYVEKLKRDYQNAPEAVRKEAIHRLRNELDSSTMETIKMLLGEGLTEGVFCPKNKEPWNSKKLVNYVRAQAKARGLLH